LKITSDARVLAGVRAALEHVCERHGLTREEQCELASAVEKECGKALENQKEPICAVAIEELEGRIEVSVWPARDVEAPASNLPKRSTASVSQNRVGAEAEPSIGSGPHVAGNGQMCATLVRHFHRNPAHS
jgi:hypothetical protein